MKATIVNGPYEGKTVDHHDLNLYCTFIPVGPYKFFLFPPLRNWDDVVQERMSKQGPFDGRQQLYWLEKHDGNVCLYHDPDGQALAKANESVRSGHQPKFESPVGAYYECAPAGQIGENLDWAELTDEKDRHWRYRKQTPEAAGSVSNGVPSGVTRLVVLHAADLEELRRNLGDVIS